MCRSCVDDPAIVGNREADNLPRTIDVNELFEHLTAPAEIPKFIQKTRSRANTVVTEGEL